MMHRIELALSFVLIVICSAVASTTVATPLRAENRRVADGPRLINPNAPLEENSAPSARLEATDLPPIPPADSPASPRIQLPVPPPPAPEHLPADRTTTSTPPAPGAGRSKTIPVPPAPSMSGPESNRLTAPIDGNSLRVPPPPTYGLIPDRTRPGYSRPASAPPVYGSIGPYSTYRPAGNGPLPTRSYAEIARLTEKLATSVREVHVYLDARGRVQPYLRQINATRESLEGMKTLEKRGYSIDALQSRYADYLTNWHLLEDSLGELAFFDPTLRQLMRIVDHYDTHLRRSLGYE